MGGDFKATKICIMTDKEIMKFLKSEWSFSGANRTCNFTKISSQAI
jgi:hypothetical protein